MQSQHANAATKAVEGDGTLSAKLTVQARVEHRVVHYDILAGRTRKTSTQAPLILKRTRYSELHRFHTNLTKEVPEFRGRLPRKTLLRHRFNSSAFVESRRIDIQGYLRAIAMDQGVSQSQAFKNFFQLQKPHVLAPESHLSEDTDTVDINLPAAVPDKIGTGSAPGQEGDAQTTVQENSVTEASRLIEAAPNTMSSSSSICLGTSNASLAASLDTSTDSIALITAVQQYSLEAIYEREDWIGGNIWPNVVQEIRKQAPALKNSTDEEVATAAGHFMHACKNGTESSNTLPVAAQHACLDSIQAALIRNDTDSVVGAKLQGWPSEDRSAAAVSLKWKMLTSVKKLLRRKEACRKLQYGNLNSSNSSWVGFSDPQ
eukprot:gnl/MRDRNA2_/MRDRNA2_239633_c0_seq1.p1 gnl/MRDRNA2_/MRDRNA2_239633_c0~~gnl/MRDRNA2_/MRDRNA2_239633_c0_seq1.p1  ORF type:complete len:374 (+),score=74.10 gnl/MRDRNA2_/MRDRNA2_239633_c0_seq1:89-1210(+)